MELSEAIRIGSKMHPQSFGGLYDYIANPAYQKPGDAQYIQATCALGAAHVGAGVHFMDFSGTMRKKFPIMGTWVECPGCGLMQETLLENIIMHLNDRHRWSREAIAMWVETMEKARDEEAAPVLAPAVPLLSYEPVTVA